MGQLEGIDKDILNMLQGNLPMVSRPFAAMGEALGLREDEVLERIKRLKSLGYIRKTGAFFNSNKLGYSGTLVAVEVLPFDLEAVAEYINQFPEITHNYERDNKYNLWFTLITNSQERKEYILSNIRSLAGVKGLLELNSKRKYKINVQFTLK